MPGVRGGSRAEVRDAGGVKLLLDENLSPRLVESLRDLYPGSQHVHGLELGEAEESASAVAGCPACRMKPRREWGTRPKGWVHAEPALKLNFQTAKRFSYPSNLRNVQKLIAIEFLGRRSPAV